MYRIYADDILIYDDTSPDPAHRAVSPKLTLKAGAAGSLTMTLTKDNAGYGSVRRMGTTIRVERDRVPIWIGRPLTERRDMWGSREMVCEGAMAFLNDTMYRYSYAFGEAANVVFGQIIDTHNASMALPEPWLSRLIDTGTVEVTDTYVLPAHKDTAWKTLADMIGKMGGILRMRYVNLGTSSSPIWRPTLDWLRDFPAAQPYAQTLEFGTNLLDFVRNWDMSDFSTFVYVEGAEIPDSFAQHYNSDWCYLADEPSPYSLYGRIEKWLDRPDLTSNNDCFDAAIAYLRTQQFGTMTLDVTALDLHILNPGIKPFDLLDRVRVISRPHGLDAWYVVTGIDIQMDDPGNTKYELEPATVEYTPPQKTLTQIVWNYGDR